MMPGTRLVVQYAEDPDWHHERLLLWPVAGDRWVVITGDNHVYDERAADYSWYRRLASRNAAYPAVVRNLVSIEPLPERSHLFRLIRRGRKEALRLCAEEGLPPITPAKWVDADGALSAFTPDSLVTGIRRRLRMRSKTPGRDLVQAGGVDSGASTPQRSREPIRFDLGTPMSDEDLWVVCDPMSSLFAMTMDLEADDPEDRYMVKELRGELTACRRVSAAEAAGFSDRCAEQLEVLVGRDNSTPTKGADVARGPASGGVTTEPPDRSLEDLRRKLEVGTMSGEKEAEDDIRTLPVDFDDHGARWKAWRVVAAEMGSHVFADWGRHLPEGTNVAFDMLGNWERKGGSPQLWLVEWLRDRNIARTERTAIEMKVLTDAITFAGSYDQINVSALMCIEVLCRRASQIIEAYDGDPGRPNWAGVRYMLGDSHSLNVVPAAARSYNARKIKDEIEVDTARNRGAARAPPSGAADDRTDAPAAGGKAGGKGAGGGAGKGGTAGGRQRARQLQAAAEP